MLRRHFFSVLGIIFVLCGIFVIVMTSGEAKRCTVSVDAVFTEYVEEESEDSDGGITMVYYPVFSYSVNGRPFLSQDNSGSSEKPYESGEKVALMYNPENPMEYVIAGDHSGIHMGIYTIAVGILCVAVDVLRAMGVFPLGRKH